jgi:hypothetical protein
MLRASVARRPEASPGRLLQLSGRISSRICLDVQECSSGSAITKQSKHLHKQSAPKLLVVYGELFAQPGNGAALWLDWAAHSLFSGAALRLPAVCESRLVRPTI